MKDALLIANDHGGCDLKQTFLHHLDELSIPYHDFGSSGKEIVRYPYFAAKVASEISCGRATRGILICSTGIGMSIIANKFKGVRASHVTSSYQAKMTRAHNDSNILCLGGMVTGPSEAIDILDAWLSTEYMGGRHDISLALIAQAEEAICNPAGWTPAGPML